MTRDDLVGQYVGHTAPKTKEVLKRAYGGVLFIDEAYYLYRPENERDYGVEAIEILLQVMENERDELVVILAGYEDRMDDFFRLNPGMSLARRPPHRLPRLRPSTSCSRSAHQMLDTENYELSPEAESRVPTSTSNSRAASRASPTPAASATRSSARGCARPTGSMRPC